jgi:hypothetical protein
LAPVRFVGDDNDVCALAQARMRRSRFGLEFLN